MSDKSKLSLGGDNPTPLVKYVVSYSDKKSDWYYNSIPEALSDAKDRNLIIEKIEKTKFNESLFGEAEGWVYEMQSLIESFLYAVRGEENYDKDFSEKFFAFNSLIKSMKSKLVELESDFENNYNILYHTERLLEEKEQC